MGDTPVAVVTAELGDVARIEVEAVGVVLPMVHTSCCVGEELRLVTVTFRTKGHAVGA